MKKIVLTAFALVSVAAASPAGVGAQNCWVRGDLDDRPSPLDSAMVAVGGAEVKVCYGAPSARGRTLIGGEGHRNAYPFGSTWRLGANEATSIHLPFAASVAGVDVDAGSYSLYAVVGETSWEIHVHGVAERWGVPIDGEGDVGSGSVPVSTGDHVERLAMSFEDASDEGATLVVAWEGYQAEVPVRRRN